MTEQRRPGPVPVALAAFFAALCFAGCARCHEGHRHVAYTPSWIELQHVSIGDSDMLIPIYHDAKCDVLWVCDVYCRDVDREKPEAHEKHKPRELRSLLVVDAGCETRSPR